MHGIAKLGVAERLPVHSRAAVMAFVTFAIDQSLPALAWGSGPDAGPGTEAPPPDG